jgi:pentatricopeptide repeat protein
MEGAFEILVNDPTVQVNGAHWASVINTWGSVYKDLDRALAVFDSIPTHPTTLRSSTPQPDAVTYEALINCLVTMKRIDLLPTYLQRLYESGIHMTAYIANFLIKGYAAAGNMDMARQIFENLHDAPIGVAAPNNHVTHDEHSEARSRDNLVYREVSSRSIVRPAVY